MKHLSDNGGCGIVAVMSLIVCLLVFSFGLYREWQVGRAGQSYEAVAATIFNANESAENFMPGLRYTYAGKNYKHNTFYAGIRSPYSRSSKQLLSNSLASHAEQGHQIQVYVYTKNPNYFVLADTPSRSFYQYLARLLASVMVFGGIIWRLYRKREGWLTIEDWNTNR